MNDTLTDENENENVYLILLKILYILNNFVHEGKSQLYRIHILQRHI